MLPELASFLTLKLTSRHQVTVFLMTPCCHNPHYCFTFLQCFVYKKFSSCEVCKNSVIVIPILEIWKLSLRDTEYLGQGQRNSSRSRTIRARENLVDLGEFRSLGIRLGYQWIRSVGSSSVIIKRWWEMGEALKTDEKQRSVVKKQEENRDCKLWSKELDFDF